MIKERLNETQKEILRIYQEAAKRRKKQDFTIARKDISKSFFRRAEASSSRGRFPFKEKEGGGEIEKLYRERKISRQLETEKEAWQRRTKELKDSKVDVTDWRERIGLKTGLRRIYSKKQELLRRGLKDLVKKGYLNSSGTGIASQYRPTEKVFKTKIPPRI